MNSNTLHENYLNLKRVSFSASSHLISHHIPPLNLEINKDRSQRLHGKPFGLLKTLLKTHNSSLHRDRSQSPEHRLPNLRIPTAVPLPSPSPQLSAVSESEKHAFSLPCAWDFTLPGPQHTFPTNQVFLTFSFSSILTSAPSHL